MIALLGALFLLFGFVFFLKLLRLIENSREVLLLSRQALSIIQNTALSDDQKEAAMQSCAKRLFVLFFILAIGLVVALFVPLGILWMAGQFGLISLKDVIALALSWEFLVGSTVVLIVAVKVIGLRSK